jgi:hypothetical protein
MDRTLSKEEMKFIDPLFGTANKRTLQLLPRPRRSPQPVLSGAREQSSSLGKTSEISSACLHTREFDEEQMGRQAEQIASLAARTNVYSSHRTQRARAIDEELSQTLD